MADVCGLDIDEIVQEKIRLNNEKYPVEKAKGKSDKYNKLQLGDEGMPIINEIKHFEFNESGLSLLKEYDKGINWPVVYLIHDDENLYIGETTSAAVRMSQHLKNDNYGVD